MLELEYIDTIKEILKIEDEDIKKYATNIKRIIPNQIVKKDATEWNYDNTDYPIVYIESKESLELLERAYNTYVFVDIE